MSHFTVIVVGENLEEQMSAYAEEGYDEKYAEFTDVEDDSLEEYKNEEADIVELKDGSVYSVYEEQFYFKKAGSFEKEVRYPEDSIQRKGKYTEIYSTFEDFMEKWHGYKQRDEEKNRYGYWSNPNAKYDYYTVGGRWSGFFKQKNKEIGNNKNTWIDIIKVCDIDIEGMQQEVVNRANETYDRIEELLDGRTYPSWITTRNKYPDDIEAARSEYRENEVVKSFNEGRFHIFGDFYEEYGHSREEYVSKCKNHIMVPYAFVKDGVWYQKGKMGWFGVSRDEMNQEEWNQNFFEMIGTLDTNTKLTLLDCHI